jgi:hypothetical protein
LWTVCRTLFLYGESQVDLQLAASTNWSMLDR